MFTRPIPPRNRFPFRAPRTAARRWLTAAAVLLLCVLAGPASPGAAADRVFADGQLPGDSRLGPLKHLNAYFPFEVPEGKAAWEARAAELRRRILVATGLWPLPEKTPLNAVIHGRVQRPGFTVEKVYFESVPNHFVTGLLFRPDDGRTGVKRPAVLCPHGHGGRQQDYGAGNMAKLIESGAEKFEKSGRFPKLARCAQLARMGCVTFIFDMLGYADSRQIPRAIAHGFAKQRPELEGSRRWGFFSAQAEMRLQSIMGLQTWNSIRCLDFLQSLPDVDPARIGVTGGSGGGTQTILLCAIDPRPIVAFTNGMVSTSMQGGCTCENCSLLRIGTGNVELAGLFAPRPQAMTAANDWTKDMMTKGYPQLQQLYAMVGSREDVYCRPLLHFPHNYNYVSRATMYNWFNRYLKIGLPEPIIETDWEPLTPGESTVWDASHPAPRGDVEYEVTLLKFLADRSDAQIARLTPQNASGLQRYREVVGQAVHTLIRRRLPQHGDIQRTKIDKQTRNGYLYFKDVLRLQTEGEELPVISFFPTNTDWNGDVVIWIDGAGKSGLFLDSGEPLPDVLRLLDGGASVVSLDLYQQGEFLPEGTSLTQQRVVKNPRQAAAYTFGYNDPLLAQRVHDVLTVLAWIRGDEHAPKRVSLMATGGAAPVAAAARAVARDAIDRLALHTGGFRFAKLTSYRDPDFLPGAVKYGDLPALLALSAPQPLFLGGEDGNVPAITRAAYVAAGSPDAVTSSSLVNPTEAAVTWLLGR